MATRKPSIKALDAAFPGKGRELRRIIDSWDAVLLTTTIKELGL